MKWNSQSLGASAIEKMKNIYLFDIEISDLDLARRFNITVSQLRHLMKKEGVYRLKSERKADRASSLIRSK